VGICILDDEDVLAVALGPDGLLAGEGPGAVRAIHITVGPRTVEGVAEAEHVERARPLLEAIARTVIPCGPLGSGAKARLCNNLMTYLAWTAPRILDAVVESSA